MKKNSKEKIAHIYADALYAAAKESNVLTKVKHDADTLLEIFMADSTLASAMSNPLLSEAERQEVLNLLGQKAKLQAATLRCLELMADEGRLGIAALVMSDFCHLCCQNDQIAEVVVETVKDLSAAQSKKLEEVLTRRLGKQVAIDYRITPSILGGLRVQYGSYLLDASLSHKLNCLENVMKGK